jgi:hypothetical protein
MPDNIQIVDSHQVGRNLETWLRGHSLTKQHLHDLESPDNQSLGVALL